jgi:hypothetical protein
LEVHFRIGLKYPKWCAALQAGNRFPKKQAPESL